MTVLVVRQDAVAELGGKRRNDPLHRPELILSELRLVLHVLTGDLRRPTDSASRADEGRPANAQMLLRTVSGLSVNDSYRNSR